MPETYLRWSAASAPRRPALTARNLRPPPATCGYVPLALYRPTTNLGVRAAARRSGCAARVAPAPAPAPNDTASIASPADAAYRRRLGQVILDLIPCQPT